MRQTKIDWCDSTVNPVMGCPNGCKYCYARKLNARFKWIEDWSKPQFFPERLKEFYSKKPRSIFIDSMSDIGTWRQEWFNAVVKAINDNPQHRYIALTKQLRGLHDKIIRMDCGVVQNLYIGVSVTHDDLRKFKPFSPMNVNFLSIEPILGAVDIRDYIDGVLSLVIIGAETGNRKGRVIPQKEWIDGIVTTCDVYGVKVFMKESLRQLMGDDFRQDRLPWEVIQ